MNYRELAANQRGFLLRSQLTEEEIQEAREAGFIINEPLLHTKQAFETQLSESSTSDIYYWAWLLAFPTIPPEQRKPTPYMAGSAALDIRGIDRIGSGDPIYSGHKSKSDVLVVVFVVWVLVLGWLGCFT